MKVRNLKANHNNSALVSAQNRAVLASMKVRNLKANHNVRPCIEVQVRAVLASMKVRNLKANHNYMSRQERRAMSCISKYEGTESES